MTAAPPVPREELPALIESVRAGERMIRTGNRWVVSDDFTASWVSRTLGVPKRCIVSIERLPPGQELALLGW